MDFFIELLFDIIVEGCIEGSTNKKVPLFIRAILLLVVSLFFLFVIGLLLLFGIKLWLDREYVVSMIMLVVTLFLVLGCIFKIKSIVNKGKNNKF